jgi:hypothetical protein
VAAHTRWLMGRNFAVITDSAAGVSAAFERDDDDKIHFDLEVTNLGPDTVLIVPEKLFYTITRDTSLGTWIDTTVYALDPEPMLREIAERRENEQADYESHLTTRNVDAIVGGIVGVVKLAKGETKKSDEERRVADSTVAAERTEQLAGYLQRDRQHDETMEQINDMERSWNAALRKTSLANREIVRGRVIFPAVRDAAALKLSVPVGARTYDFIFRQQQIKR